MRCVKRNMKPFWYCKFEGYEAVTDAAGYETGENRLKYSEPILAYGNISAGSTMITYGTLIMQPFGQSPRYDRVIVMEDPNFEMDGNAVLFVEKEPSFTEDGSPENDYVVKKVARSLNGVSYAILRVRNDPNED